jgi:hypothetical protein
MVHKKFVSLGRYIIVGVFDILMTAQELGANVTW